MGAVSGKNPPAKTTIPILIITTPTVQANIKEILRPFMCCLRLIKKRTVAIPSVELRLHDFREMFYFSLKWNGIETQTSTGPFCIIAGVKTICFAASIAAWSKISEALF